MEDKVAKIFSYFDDLKHENVFSLCVGQLVELYEVCPQSLRIIMYYLRKFFFSTSKDSRLKLKHRQLAASLVGKLAQLYTRNLEQFAHEDATIEMEQFQMEDYQPGEEAEPESGDWLSIDFVKEVQQRTPLVASDRTLKETESELKELQQRFFKKMKDMQTATETNLNYMLGHFMEEDDKQEEQPTEGNNSDRKSKLNCKMEKLNMKNEEKMKLAQQLTIFNPFNYVYELCMQNLLNPLWEMRHLAVLLLRAFQPYLSFIGFRCVVDVARLPQQEMFRVITDCCRQELIFFQKNRQHAEKRNNNIITNCIYLLALDKFGDLQFDKINNMIRDVAAEVLAVQYCNLQCTEQFEFLTIVKGLLEHREGSKNGRQPFSWDLRYSFVSLLYNIMGQGKGQQRESVYQLFFDTFLTMLQHGEDQDDVVLAICDCYNQLWGQKCFSREYALEVGKQVWCIVEHIDDITYAAISILKLLELLIDDCPVDQLICLTRVKKFFVNKIRDVRKQFYALLGQIYSKLRISWQSCPDSLPEIIETNIEQYLQALIMEEDDGILEELTKLGVSMSGWLFSPAGMAIVTRFCKEVLINFTVRQCLVDSKFKHRCDDSGYRSIGRDEKIQDLSDFIFLRIFKFAEVLAPAVSDNAHTLEPLITELCKMGQSENRLNLLALCLIYNAIKAKPIDLPSSLIVLVENILKLEESKLNSHEFHIFSKEIAAMVGGLASKTACMLAYVEQPSWQNTTKLYKETKEQYQSNPGQADGRILAILSTLDLIICNQLELIKYIRIFGSFCHCWRLKEQPKPLNIIIKAVHECMKVQRFWIVSRATTDAAFELSRILLAKNRSVYDKFNRNMLDKVGKGYEHHQLRADMKRNDRRFNSVYMESLGLYLLSVVKLDEGWLATFKGSFFDDLRSEDSEKTNSSLQILSGTADKLMQICTEEFFREMLQLLDSKLTIGSNNSKFLVAILKSLLLQSVKGFGKLSGIYLQWMYDCLERGDVRFFGVLETALNTDIATLSPICCVFLLRIIKSMTCSSTRELSMRCLPNLLMGAFVSTRSLPFVGRLAREAEEGNTFVRDFKNIKNFEYDIVVKGNLELRSYQLEGVKWMGFLIKYMLSGALCDDMGLGKTMQTFTVMENEYMKLLNRSKEEAARVSLVICPTTLIEHWLYEYKKYFPKGILECRSVYDKTSIAHEEVFRGTPKKPMLIITSYSCIEKNVEMFEGLDLKFLILDEGHLIKNTRTKKFQAIKKLQSEHRFILTGTPVQNKLLELWGIFDFLMPGYLQTEEQFRSRYEKLFNVNLLTFKQDDLLFTQQQKGTLEALHLKVMPFILRRLKSQVLKELPEKIIQDYYCQMTAEQRHLYRGFHHEAKSHDLHTDSFDSESNSTISLLTKMRKILNHPNLVEGRYSYQASGKFIALKQLLDDLGFADGEKSMTSKIIVFSRFNHTLDLIEELLIKKVFPQIYYLKLTGAISNNKRFAVAQKFNDDANIKMLLVTTMVGGYGLNLTSANVVIMFDHDYNPTVDMQAIDRAHRLGQKNILNVYRLITKDTLEEKIMGIQRFKTNLANAIVNIDNASIKNIEQSKLPDLLEKVANLQKSEPKVTQRLSKSFYSNLLKEMEQAIQYDDYGKEY